MADLNQPTDAPRLLTRNVYQRTTTYVLGATTAGKEYLALEYIEADGNVSV